MRCSLVLAAAMLSGLVVACGGNSTPPPPQTPAPIVNPVDPATASTLTGHVTLTGTPPPNQPITTTSDPNCKAPLTTETILTGAGGTLENVFVYVKDGLGDLAFPVPATPVRLEQQDCRYLPHVFGIQVGQTLEIVSNDPTLHNIHAVPEINQEFNLAQANKGDQHTHVFSTAEVLVPFKCDVHNWMTAYAGVVAHPFHAVTSADGTFELAGLPPGTYTIEAVHETLGRRTQSITIGASETRDLPFTFEN